MPAQPTKYIMNPATVQPSSLEIHLWIVDYTIYNIELLEWVYMLEMITCKRNCLVWQMKTRAMSRTSSGSCLWRQACWGWSSMICIEQTPAAVWCYRTRWAAAAEYSRYQAVRVCSIQSATSYCICSNLYCS